MTLEQSVCEHPCALDVKWFAIGDRELRASDPIRGRFSDILEIAGIEFLEGYAGPLSSGITGGKTLTLKIRLEGPPVHAWSLWLDDCDGPYLPEIIWRISDNGNRGPVHAVLTDRIAEEMNRILKENPFQTGSEIVIRADISNVSTHEKFEMILTRKRALAKEKGSLK